MTPPNRPPRVGDIVRSWHMYDGCEALVTEVTCQGRDNWSATYTYGTMYITFRSWDEVVYLGSLARQMQDDR